MYLCTDPNSIITWILGYGLLWFEEKHYLMLCCSCECSFITCICGNDVESIILLCFRWMNWIYFVFFLFVFDPYSCIIYQCSFDFMINILLHFLFRNFPIYSCIKCWKAEMTLRVFNPFQSLFLFFSNKNSNSVDIYFEYAMLMHNYEWFENAIFLVS